MIKRIISLFIVFILTFSLIGTIPTFAAAKDSDVNLMFDLGIVKKIKKTGLFDTGYTRSDFAHTLAMLDKGASLPLGSEDESNEYASDIADNEYYNDIVEAIKSGYMKVDEQKRFRPSYSLTLDDAIYALINALGYNVLANPDVEEAVSYKMIAQKIGLLKGVKIADPNVLDDDEIANIVANAMSIRFFLTGNVSTNDICFFDSWDLTVNTGILYANANIGISGEEADYKRVNIDGKLYYTEILIPDEMVGSEVTFYVDNSKIKNEIISIYATSSEDSITIDSNDISYVEEEGKYVVVYLDNDEEIEILKNGFAIVNGKTFTPSKKVFDLFKTGKATFLDSDSDGNYDIVNISLMVQKVIGGLIAKDKVMSDLFTGETMNFDKAQNLEVYINNRAADFSELKEGYVVGICCDNYVVSDAGVITNNYNKAKTIKIYASGKKVSAEVEEFEADKIIMDGMEYTFSPGYLELIRQGSISELKLGDWVIAYLDMFGNIAYYELDENKRDLNYGYLIMYGVSESDAFANRSKFKIMDSKGNIDVYESGEKFVLDGERVLGGQQMYTVNHLPLDLTKRQVVRFYAKDGILKELDTTAVREGFENESNTLSEDIPIAYNTNGSPVKTTIKDNIVNRKAVITDTSICFMDGASVGDDSPNDEDFWVGSMESSASDEVTGYLSCYDVDKDLKVRCFVNHLKLGADSALSYLVPARLVEKVTTAVNEKGDSGYNIYLAGNSEYRAFFVPYGKAEIFEPIETDAWSTSNLKLQKVNNDRIDQVLKPGDVVKVNVNISGEVNRIEKWFDFVASNGECEFAKLNGEIKVTGDNYCFTHLEDATGDFFIYSDAERETKYIATKLEKTSTFPVFNVNLGKVKMVSISDIPTISKGKENVKIYLRFRANSCRDQIIYVYD